MLPFLAPKKMAGTIIAKTKSNGGLADQHEESEHHPELLSIAENMIRGIHNKEASAVADAFLKLFQHAELMPHKEIEHDEDGE